MKSSEICALAIQIVAFQYGEVQYCQNNTTHAPSGEWRLLTWFSGAWHADCYGFVRAVLCGWHADKTVTAGGANMNYNCYVNWFDDNKFLQSCTSTSTNFAVMTPCELLYKPGHLGLYVGEFQLNGLTYNTCEVTISAKVGGVPAWVDTQGRRWTDRDSGISMGSAWTHHGIFNLNGTDYGITEYDGGAIPGATGFGTELTDAEVNYYWNTLPELTYSYVEAVANSVHGMPADVFAVMAGWGWGEAYSREYPINWNQPDYYLAYLCDCNPVNYFEGYNIRTAQAMADQIRGGATGDYYSLAALTNRAHQLEAAESTASGQAELRALLLALLNPDQRSVFCCGPWANVTIIYQNTYQGEGVIAAFYDGSYAAYDITGTGIRGGLPDPSDRTHTGMRLYQYLRPWQHYRQYQYLTNNFIGRRFR